MRFSAPAGAHADRRHRCCRCAYPSIKPRRSYLADLLVAE